MKVLSFMILILSSRTINAMFGNLLKVAHLKLWYPRGFGMLKSFHLGATYCNTHWFFTETKKKVVNNSKVMS